MAGVPFWGPDAGTQGSLYADNPWDRVTLGGDTLPGQCEVQDPVVALRLDPKGASGRNGANPTAHGTDPQPFKIRVLIWTPEQLRELERILPRLIPRNDTAKPTPFDVAHPGLALLGIRAVIVTQVGGFKSASLAGARELTITCREWRPARSSGTKKPSVTTTPTRSVRNARREDAERRAAAQGAAAANQNTALPSRSSAARRP